jgi:uncharacterized lipoprotein YmbA
MRPWKLSVSAVALSILAACSSPQEQVRYYMLSATAHQAQAQLGSAVVLGVGPVSVPRHLDRPEITQRTSAHRLSLRPLDHWAEPLSDTIPRVMSQNLEIALGLTRVESFPYTRSAGVTHQLTMELLAFDQAADGEVHMDVRWRLLNAEDDTLLAGRTTRLRVTPTNNSVDAIVEALSASLTALSDEVSRIILRLST